MKCCADATLVFNTGFQYLFKRDLIETNGKIEHVHLIMDSSSFGINCAVQTTVALTYNLFMYITTNRREGGVAIKRVVFAIFLYFYYNACNLLWKLLKCTALQLQLDV